MAAVSTLSQRITRQTQLHANRAAAEVAGIVADVGIDLLRVGQTAFAAAAEDAQLHVQRVVQIGRIAHRFATAEKEHTVGIERKAEQIHRFFLQHRLQINQHIAAGNQINIGEGRIFQQVVRRKHHHFPNVAGNMKIVIFALKILAQQMRRQISDDAFRVHPIAGALHGVTIDIGGEDFDINRTADPIHDFAADHGQRVGLFAR